jgi:hypothetical protein
MVKSGEAVWLSLKVGHGADVAERAVHVDDDCRLAVHGTPISQDVSPGEDTERRRQRGYLSVPGITFG